LDSFDSELGRGPGGILNPQGASLLLAGVRTKPGPPTSYPALGSGRRFRTFNVIDDFSREALRIEIDTSLPSGRVIRALDELVELRGKPKRLRLDNGPELISHALAQWARDNLVELCFIQPGKPTQNALIERFNRTVRTEVLDRYIFNSMNEVRQMLEDWRHRYNHQRPHSALGGVPPARYAMAHSSTSSTSE
jgi:putative transposase